MVLSLEHLARNAVYETSFHKMRTKKKKFFVMAGEKEHIQQCRDLAKATKTIKTHRLGLNSLLIILN